MPIHFDEESLIKSRNQLVEFSENILMKSLKTFISSDEMPLITLIRV